MSSNILEKYSFILQQYSKLEQLNCDFSTLEFNEQQYCISLSGGVDSMVLMDILYKKNKKIIAIHMNYNNRDESKDEEDFLREYCNERNINFICHSFNFKRGSIKRSDYESLTKQIKFEIYKNVLTQYNLNSILLAHHKDDVIENVFTNFCKGENFLNLSVIKESNFILGVNIVRPLVNYFKQNIYDYAHFYEIPYFLDTTPNWSVRGKFRNNLLPILFNTFTGLKQNLLSIAKESDQWGTLIQSRFIDKYLNYIIYSDLSVEMPIKNNLEDYSEYPICFWSIILAKIFHKFGKSAPSRKSLEIFVNLLKIKNDNTLLLKHNTKLFILNLNLKIIKIIFI